MLGSRADGAPAQIAVGQEFGVQLAEHPSVGYTWEAVDLPPELRASGRDSTVPANVQPGGDSGLTTFRFVALRPGTLTLRMVNKFRGDPEGEALIRIVIR